MSKNYAIIIQSVLPLRTFYRSGAQKSNVYKRDVFVTSWRFHNRAWQPRRHDRLPETSGTLWIHRGALTNQRCSLATGCGINIWSLEFSRYVCFSFRGNRPFFWLRYSQFDIWPWKFKVKIMVKVKPDGHIWSLEFSRCVCFSFRGNRTIFGWDIANSIFYLENSRSRSRRAKNERNPKSCSKVIAWTRTCGRGRRRRRTNRYKNIKSPPVYRGDLMNW